LIAWPTLAVVLEAAQGSASDAPQRGHSFAPQLLARTLAVGLVIAFLATVVGLPGAWLIRRRAWSWFPLLAAPLFTPAYLASSGFNILRAPGTPFGDWLGELSRSGSQWATLFAGKAIAVIGLSLWASPIASAIIAAGLRTVGNETLDALALDASRPRKCLALLNAIRGYLLASILLIAALMLGSAVPLHLAQVKTTALLAWLTLQQTGSVRAAVVACAPLTLIAAAAGVWATLLLERRPARETLTDPSPSNPSHRFLAALAPSTTVLSLSVLLPTVLFATQIRNPSALRRFWLEAGDSVSSSAIIAVGVGLLCAALAALVFATRSSSALRLLVAAFVAAALVPGILVGCAWRLAWPNTWPDSAAIVILAHTTRFGIVGVLGGLLLKRLEDQPTRDLMHIDGVQTLSAWWRASGLRLAAPWVATAVVAGIFSFHEIEAAVVVQPAGAIGLPQRLLNDLHQLRMEAMSAAALWMTAVGLFAALTIGVISTLVHRQTTPTTKPDQTKPE